jgi:DNA-directed RNA polymerase specialized sigma24 family protein
LDRFDAARGCRLTTFLAAIARSEAASLLRSERRRRRREKIASRSEATFTSADQTSAPLLELHDILTPREREFVDSCLAADDSKMEISDANRWQLRHRVREKLERLLRG